MVIYTLRVETKILLFIQIFVIEQVNFCMKHEIKIYGDIVPFKWVNDGSEYDLKDLNNSLSNLTVSEGDELIIGIHTFGGDTATAFGIFNMLLRFKNDNKVTLTTRVDAWCASSGVIILLAGDKRIGNSYAEPFVHNAWTYMGFSTTADEAKKAYEDLTKVEDQISTLYSNQTNISKEKAKELMDADNYVSAEDCLAYGFYTELENVYVGAENSMVFNSLRQRHSENKNKIKNNMSNQNQKDAWKNIKNMVDKFFGGAKNKVVFTADNSELDFYELDDTATPAVGDKAKYDGKPAGDSNDGKYTMTSGETYRFEGEELVEIIPKEDGDTTDLEAENAALTAENETLKTEIENLKAEKGTLNKKLSDATAIIKGFQNLTKENDEEEEDAKRDPKSGKEDGKQSRVGGAINKLKNINTDGGNK